jgi:hypothetical protein
MKKPINESAKLRRLAGLITESEYQEEMMKSKEKMEEAIALKLKGYYQILDAGTNEWNDDYQYMGKVAGGSSAGEVGEHMFVYPDAPGSFTFVSIPDTDLDTMVKPSMSEGKEKDETWFSDMNYFKKEHEGYKLKPTDMVSIGDIPSMTYAQAVKKFIKKEQFGGINEALEPHVYERMFNLSNIKAQQAMIRAAEILMRDLTEEGFEVPEIREFFTQLIANDI